MAPHSELLTNIIGSVFSHGYDQPVHAMNPMYERPTVRPILERPTVATFNERTTLRPVLRTSTTVPFWKRPFVRLFPESTTVRPVTIRPTIAPPTVEPWHATGLEFLWVALGGLGVLLLLAIFMKLGKPIRRASRQLSSPRPATLHANVRQHPDANITDMEFPLLRPAAPLPPRPPLPPHDPPPPYAQCARAAPDKPAPEEPPPRFSDCFVSYTNPHHAEPQVHIRRQNDTHKRTDSSSDIVKVQNGLIKNDPITVSCNHSEHVAVDTKTELVFDNGGVVKWQSLYI